MELTPEQAKILADFALEKKGLIPKKKRVKSIKITTVKDKDGNTISSKSHITLTGNNPNFLSAVLATGVQTNYFFSQAIPSLSASALRFHPGGVQPIGTGTLLTPAAFASLQFENSSKTWGCKFPAATFGGSIFLSLADAGADATEDSNSTVARIVLIMGCTCDTSHDYFMPNSPYYQLL